MSLERTERPIHIPDETPPKAELPCDYIDVMRKDGDQPQFHLQPHFDGGKPLGPVIVLDREAAAGLVQHLGKLLEVGADGDTR